MQCSRTCLENNKQIPKNAIKIALPQIRQQKCYSCGASALHVICKYFKVGYRKEEDYRKLLNTTYKLGTCPKNIVEGAKTLGLKAILRSNMSLKRLKIHLDKRMPVICSMQAWGRESTYPKAKCGHYVVAIGYDKNHFYFEDPSIDLGQRGYLTTKEFNERWHDIEADGKHYYHLGIAVWKNRYKKSGIKLKKATKIS